MCEVVDVGRTSRRDLILAFMGYADEKSCKSFPSSAKAWRMLIDTLRKDYVGCFPAFPCVIELIDIHDVLDGLAITGICTWSHIGERMIIEDHTIFEKKKEELLEHGGRELLDLMLDLARHEPGFFIGESLMNAVEHSNCREAGFAIGTAILIATAFSAMFYGFEKLYDVFVAQRMPTFLN